jgi:hypothetical protein
VSVATAPPPTPVQRPPEKQVQRTAHSSAVGHGLGLGGNGALWAFGTYGWGWAAAIGGATAIGMGAKHLRNRRGRGGRGSGLFGGRGGGSRGGLLGRLGGGGRGRSGGGLGLGGGKGRSGGSPGSKGGKAGGFLRKLAGNRSSTPRSGGGLTGRGTGKGKGGLLGRGKGGSGLPGGGRGGRGLGSRSPGAGRGRSGGLLGGSRGSRSRSGSGLGAGRGRGSGASTRGGRGSKGGFLSKLNPFKRGKTGGSSSTANASARKFLDRLNRLKRKSNPQNKNQRKQQTPRSGWTEAPLNPTGTEWKDRTMTGSTRRRVPAPSRGTGGGSGGGNLTAAGEVFAAALAKPSTEVNTLKTFDRDLGDLAGAVEAMQGGMKNHAAVVQAGMPDESAAHEELSRYSQQLGQMAEGLKILQADQRRRNALDHQRVEDGRKNEKGYDWQANQQ